MYINTDENQHYAKIKRILLVILLLNWAVAAVKIIYGLITGSHSITADGFHSLSDGASNIIGFIGIHIASQPKDSEHPYGHKKYETLFSLFIAFMLFIIAINLLRQSIPRLSNPIIPKINLFSFIIMLTTFVINIFVVKYESKQGNLLKSDILTADAIHTKTDLLITSSVFVALIAIKLGFPIMDLVIAILISIFIAKSGIKIVKSSAAILCDTQSIEDTKKVSNIVLSVRGVKSCHKIRSRGRKDDIYLDLHVQVEPNMPIDKAHQISNKIETLIKDKLDGVTDVIIHLEPKH
ncbi:MAG: cation diffusion facilitator family transporter [Candidatus Gygaella obscura]|nr:cation diffusion facilitator family transporter [Candidatus Gygaella obscura]